MISARALGVYLYLLNTESSISAENLSAVFKEGREAMSTALRELREVGAIKTKKEKINGRIMTFSVLVEPGYWTPETRFLIQRYMQNSNLILNAYSLINKKRVIGFANGEETAMDEWQLGRLEIDPDEVAELRRKDKERKQAEYEAIRAAKAEARIAESRARTPYDWSVDNAVYEFAQRLVRWDISPWEGARTRFLAAYAQARKAYNTRGDVEIKMMDRFFDSLAHDKSVKDPEKLWRLFITKFGSLLKEVQLSTVTSESFEEAENVSEKQWGKLFNV